MRLAQEVERLTFGAKVRRKIAVMGCAVNGPGEAKDCDLGIAGGRENCVIFKRGEIVRSVPREDAEDVFLREVRACLEEG